MQCWKPATVARKTANLWSCKLNSPLHVKPLDLPRPTSKSSSNISSTTKRLFLQNHLFHNLNELSAKKRSVTHRLATKIHRTRNRVLQSANRTHRRKKWQNQDRCR